MVSAALTDVQTGAWRVQARVNFHLNYFEDFELQLSFIGPEGAPAQTLPVEEPSEPKGYSYPVPGSKHIFYQMNPDIKVISHIEDQPMNQSINVRQAAAPAEAPSSSTRASHPLWCTTNLNSCLPFFNTYLSVDIFHSLLGF